MKSTSIKRWSILSMVLLAASAVTAAILPSNKNNDSDKFAFNGSITVSSDGLNSCTATNGVYGQACHNSATAGSSTGGTSTVNYVSDEASTVGDVD